MKLLTKEIAEKFPALYANEKLPAAEVKVIAKFFNPTGAGTWYATEYDPKEKLFFGYVDLGMGPTCSELGYFSLAELEGVEVMFGLGIERDIHFGFDTTLAEVMAA